MGGLLFDSSTMEQKLSLVCTQCWWLSSEQVIPVHIICTVVPEWAWCLCHYVFQHTKLLLTYQPQHMTTSCWCGSHGTGAVSFSCGRIPSHSISPSTCWRRFWLPPGPLRTAVHTHRRQDVHTEGIPLLKPFYVPSHRYGSLDLKVQQEICGKY